MGDRAAKDALYDGLAAVAKALGNGRRAEIVDVLAQGERPVEALADEIGQSVANTSHHLQHLLRAGLVRTRRDGTRIHYSLATPRVGELWAAVRDVARAQVAEVEGLGEAYLGDRSGLDTISREALARRVHEGDVVVLDVRPEAEFRAGTSPGASPCRSTRWPSPAHAPPRPGRRRLLPRTVLRVRRRRRPDPAPPGLPRRPAGRRLSRVGTRGSAGRGRLTGRLSPGSSARR